MFIKVQTALLAIILLISFQAKAQSVLNPYDSITEYNPDSPPADVPNGEIGKWVRTKSANWNTDSYKAYIYNGNAFRLHFPKTYNPSANDGKKYPMLIFFHGLGEASTVYDNEQQLYHCGPVFDSAINNGSFDGYALFMQSTGYWGPGQYQAITDIINYMIVNNKLDPFQIATNGLSGGGQGAWEMLLNYPNYITAALPMSNVSIGYTDSSVVNSIMFTKIWLFQGGLDQSPAPSTAEQVRDAMLAAGANFTYTEYANLGHGTWDRATHEPDFSLLFYALMLLIHGHYMGAQNFAHPTVLM